MELNSLDSMSILVFFVLLPVMFLLSILVHFKVSCSKLPYPPGPKGLPLIGNISMMGHSTHKSLAELGQRYGGIVHLRIGKLHMVSVTAPEIARQVLQVQDSVFSDRPANGAIKYLTYDRSDMVFANYGPFLRQMRKLCVMKLFSRKREESWNAVREEVDSTIATVLRQTGSPVNVGQLAFIHSMNVTFRAAFGVSDAKADGNKDYFISILQEYSELLGALNVADFFPWLNWMDPQGLSRRLVKARKSIDEFIATIIDKHIKKTNSNGDAVDKDMVDELLAFYGKDGKKDVVHDDVKVSVSLSRDNIKGIIMDVMFGGVETVASTIEWVMTQLLHSPEDLRKVEDELNEVVGLNRRVQETDLNNLTYLKCCIKETLRLHPPVPLLLHENSQETEVAGYTIPSRSRIMINTYAICRNKDAWVDADAFKPSRFLDEGAANFKGCHFEFIPFGSGRRSRPGMQLGMYELELTLAHLLHSFSWKLPNGLEPSDMNMNDVPGLTAPREVRLVAVPSTRLNGPVNLRRKC
ncbi:cytochrome P450 84A1-like [Papaver somniferum]|uniref:cytochrome P450 84A1-like n=1 Tax=Papaver somniferum TaxID=3469 RepID=UPI000E6FC7C0|nr:cytochrome P450 84A1-like [Papaver somniferum]